jgi:hypothetical protein
MKFLFIRFLHSVMFKMAAYRYVNQATVAAQSVEMTVYFGSDGDARNVVKCSTVELACFRWSLNPFFVMKPSFHLSRRPGTRSLPKTTRLI